MFIHMMKVYLKKKRFFMVCVSLLLDLFICLNFRRILIFFFKQKTTYEMRISDWGSDVCSSDLTPDALVRIVRINRCGSRSRHSLAAKCAALGRALPVVAAATGGEHQGHPPFRSRSIIDRTGLLDKFGQFRRAHARRGLPSRAARTTPIDFASPSPSRASPAGQSRRPQAAASPKGVKNDHPDHPTEQTGAFRPQRAAGEAQGNRSPKSEEH